MWDQCFCGHDFGPADEEKAPASTRRSAPKKPASVARLCSALLFGSLACASLLADVPVFTAPCFLLASWLVPPSAEDRPAKAWDWFLGINLSAVVLLSLLLLRRWIPDAPFLQHPAFVVPLWLFFIIITCRSWRRQQRAFSIPSGATVA
jgi:hypothetical protein